MKYRIINLKDVVLSIKTKDGTKSVAKNNFALTGVLTDKLFEMQRRGDISIQSLAGKKITPRIYTLNSILQKSPKVLYGTKANVPPPTKQPTIYIVTDEKYLLFNDGSSNVWFDNFENKTSDTVTPVQPTTPTIVANNKTQLKILGFI